MCAGAATAVTRPASQTRSHLKESLHLPPTSSPLQCGSCESFMSLASRPAAAAPLGPEVAARDNLDKTIERGERERRSERGRGEIRSRGPHSQSVSQWPTFRALILRTSRRWRWRGETCEIWHLAQLRGARVAMIAIREQRKEENNVAKQ